MCYNRERKTATQNVRLRIVNEKRWLQKKRHIIILLCVPDLFDRVKSKMKRHQFLINFMQKTLSFRCIYDWSKCIKYSSKIVSNNQTVLNVFFFQCTIKGEEKREKNASIFFFICASKHIMFSESTEWHTIGPTHFHSRF